VSVSRTLCALVVTAVALAGTPLPARAGGVALEVVSVLATNSGSVLDPRLRRQRPNLVGFPYSSYRLLRREVRFVPWGRRARFNLPGPGELKVSPRNREGAGIALNLALRGQQRRRLIDTSLCLQDHRVLLVGGPRHRNGVLIIVVGAEAGGGQ
jgi:hypothetical protein